MLCDSCYLLSYFINPSAIRFLSKELIPPLLPYPGARLFLCLSTILRAFSNMLTRESKVRYTVESSERAYLRSDSRWAFICCTKCIPLTRNFLFRWGSTFVWMFSFIAYSPESKVYRFSYSFLLALADIFASWYFLILDTLICELSMDFLPLDNVY